MNTETPLTRSEKIRQTKAASNAAMEDYCVVRSRELAAEAEAKAFLQKLDYEVMATARWHTEDFLFHVGLHILECMKHKESHKELNLMRQTCKISAQINNFIIQLRLCVDLNPSLSGMEHIRLLRKHGLLPQDLFDNLTLREAYEILAVRVPKTDVPAGATS